MNIQQRARQVRLIMEGLPECDIYTVSLDNEEKDTREGCVVCQPRDLAARSIAEKTHRIATEAEVKAHQEAQRLKGDQIRKDEMERRFPLNLKVYAGEQPKAVREK